jgi:hypothetical protein
MSWYRSANMEEKWNVVKIKDSVFQLRFEETPIMDYLLADRGDIKEVKTYGMNFMKNVPRGIPLPPILFMFSRAKDLL